MPEETPVTKAMGLFSKAKSLSEKDWFRKVVVRLRGCRETKQDRGEIMGCESQAFSRHLALSNLV